MKYYINGKNKKTFTFEEINKKEIKLNDEIIIKDLIKINDHTYHIIHNNKSYNLEIIHLDYDEKICKIKVNQNIYTLKVKNEITLLLEKMGIHDVSSIKVSTLKAPMPGSVLKLNVKENSEVKKGDILIILEAMKMENAIKSPISGKIKKINIKEGDNVEKNEILITFE